MHDAWLSTQASPENNDKTHSHWSACTLHSFPTQPQINMSELALWWPFVAAFLLKENSCRLCFKAISKKDATSRKLGTVATSAARYQVDRNTTYIAHRQKKVPYLVSLRWRATEKRWFGKTQSACSGPQTSVKGQEATDLQDFQGMSQL